jgi:hypothetical protein
MSKAIFCPSKMQFLNEFGNAQKVPQAEAYEISTKQACLDFTSPKTSIVTRLNDTDEGAWKLIGLTLIFIFVRNPDKGRSHVRAMKITTLWHRSWDFSCSYARFRQSR